MSKGNLKSNHNRIGALMVGAMVVALWSGCKDKTKENEPMIEAANDPGMDDIPGRDTSKTRQYLKGLRNQWTTAIASVTIHCDSVDCPGHAKDSVHIRIDTHQKAFKIDAVRILARNAHNVNGQIVLKFVNLDAFEYTPLGLKPNDSSYLWVGKTDTAAQLLPPSRRERSFAVFRIGEDGTAEGVARVYRAIHCDLGSDPLSSAVHLRKIDTCEEHARLDTLYNEPVPPDSRISGLNQPLHDQGLWFSCPGGCCQSSTFGPY